MRKRRDDWQTMWRSFTRETGRYFPNDPGSISRRYRVDVDREARVPFAAPAPIFRDRSSVRGGGQIASRARNFISSREKRFFVEHVYRFPRPHPRYRAFTRADYRTDRDFPVSQ